MTLNEFMAALEPDDVVAVGSGSGFFFFGDRREYERYYAPVNMLVRRCAQNKLKNAYEELPYIDIGERKILGNRASCEGAHRIVIVEGYECCPIYVREDFETQVMLRVPEKKRTKICSESGVLNLAAALIKTAGDDLTRYYCGDTRDITGKSICPNVILSDIRTYFDDSTADTLDRYAREAAKKLCAAKKGGTQCRR